ncbi:MAG: hypothetical protein PHS77_05405 [Gallionellaceae bacterium]|nr:hypothetical protein [Gallionellaceae bacterium]
MKTLLTLLLALPALAWAAPARTPVKFGDALYAKFHHERCLQCHQFNSRRSNGRAWTSHRSRYLCESCHAPRLTGLAGGEWLAPAGERMDYTGYSARDTCLLVKRNAATGDKAQVLTRHLLHDVRVIWSLDRGTTPAGKRATVPGGYAEWERDVKAWIADGMLCE